MFVHHFLSFWIHDCIIHLGNEPHHLGLPKYDIDKMLWIYFTAIKHRNIDLIPVFINFHEACYILIFV